MGHRIEGITHEKWVPFVLNQLEEGLHGQFPIDDSHSIDVDLQQMIEITDQILRRSTINLDQRDTLVSILAALFTEKIGINPESPRVTTIFYRTLSSNFTLTREREELLNSELAKMEACQTGGLTSSNEGAVKIQMVRTGERPKICFKRHKTPATHIVADKFFGAYGFTNPQFQAISKDSDLGNTIDRYFVAIQLRSMRDLPQTHFLVGNYIVGTSFFQLADTDRVNSLRDPNVLKELGEMLFLDRVIYNTDRVTTSSQNAGNYMLLDEPDENGRMIALVDNDYCLDSDNFNLAVQTMVDLLSKNNLNQLVHSLVSYVPEISDGLNRAVDKNQMVERIWEGIQKAKTQFLEKFSDKNLVYRLFELPSELVPKKRLDPNLFLKMYKIVQSVGLHYDHSIS